MNSDSCSDCSEPLEFYPNDQPRPPCPKCGSTKRNRSVVLSEFVKISDSLKVTKKTLENEYDSQIEKYQKKIDEAKDIRRQDQLKLAKQLLISHKNRELDKIKKKLGELKQKEPEINNKTFSADVILVDTPKNPKEAETIVGDDVKCLEDVLQELGKKVDVVKKNTDDIKGMVSWKSTIGLMILTGVIAGIIVPSVSAFVSTASDFFFENLSRLS